MARPYKGYRRARVDTGDTLKSQASHRDGRYDVERKPLPVVAVATPHAALAVTVDSSATPTHCPNGDAVTVKINFGEGLPVAGGAAVSHTYATPGVKSIVVTATASNGQTSTKTLSVTAAA